MEIKKQYGLVGYPLGHSFSQRFFTDKFEKEGINASFSNYEMESVKDILSILQSTPNLKGFNVTIPHKESIIPLLASLSDEALEIGAVNVVKVNRSDDKISLKGYNSDVVGFINSIEPLLEVHHKKALVLGTGGASKAIVYGLNKLGIDVQLVSRRKGENTITYDELTKKLMSEYTVVVNCTPLGTYPKVNEAPSIPYEFLGDTHLLYDLVYNPEKTAFLKRGELRGVKIKNGAEMLELQALEAWKIWNNNN